MKKILTRKTQKEIEKRYSFLAEKQGMILEQAFHLPKGAIEKIPFSGRTLRKIIKGQHVRKSTIIKLLESLKIEWCIVNNKIDIKENGKEL